MKRYIEANPNSALSYDILPLLARAGNQYLLGAGNRIASNLTAIPALFNEKNYSEEVQKGKDILRAIAEYQKEETPASAVGADVAGALGSALVLGRAAPVTFGANVTRATPLFTRAGQVARGAAAEQALRSAVGEDGIYEKAVQGGEKAKDGVLSKLLGVGKGAYQAVPKALEEITVSTLTAPLAQEFIRPLGKAVQYGAGKLGVDDVSKYLTSETAALRKAGLSPDDVEAGRLVTGQANIPGATKENQKLLGEVLRRDAAKAAENVQKAKDVGIDITSMEAYGPYSNVVRDLNQKALASSPRYSQAVGEMRLPRAENIGQQAAELRPQLQAAKDRLYKTVVGEQAVLPINTGSQKVSGARLSYEDIPITQQTSGGSGIRTTYEDIPNKLGLSEKQTPYSYGGSNSVLFDPTTGRPVTQTVTKETPYSYSGGQSTLFDPATGAPITQSISKQTPYSYNVDRVLPETQLVFDPITGKSVLQTRPLTVGQLNEQKIAAYGQGNMAEADRIKNLLRDNPTAAKAEELYRMGEDMQALKRAGGINRYEPTAPYTGEVDIESALGKGQNLKDVTQLIRGKNLRPEQSIPSTENYGADPALFLRTPNPTVRGNLNVLDFLDRRLTNTPQKYFDKLSPALAGMNLPDVASKAGQFGDVFTAQSMSNPVGRAATIGAFTPATGVSEDYPEIKPVQKRKLSEQDFDKPVQQQSSPFGARKLTLEDFE